MSRRRGSQKTSTRDKVVAVVLVTIFVSIGVIALVPIVEENTRNRYYIAFSSPEMEKLEIYAGFYFDATSLTKHVRLVENLTSMRVDMRHAYQILVFEKIVSDNGTFEWHEHDRVVFDYMSLSENDNKAFIPLMNTNLTIIIIEG